MKLVLPPAPPGQQFVTAVVSGIRRWRLIAARFNVDNNVAAEDALATVQILENSDVVAELFPGANVPSGTQQAYGFFLGVDSRTITYPTGEITQIEPLPDLTVHGEGSVKIGYVAGDADTIAGGVTLIIEDLDEDLLPRASAR